MKNEMQKLSRKKNRPKKNKGTVKERELRNQAKHSMGKHPGRKGGKFIPPAQTQHGKVARALRYLKDRFGRF